MTSLAGLVRASKAILLDFDGPVCLLFAGGRNQLTATAIRLHLEALGIALPSRFDSNRDPLKLLRWVSDEHPDRTPEVEQLLIACEVTAAETVPPTEGAERVLKAAARTDRPVSIVSNNAEAAISRFLELHGLSGFVAHIAGRAYANPKLMKPHPDAVHRAVANLSVPPDKCILIGDTTTDMEASLAAGVRPVGFSKGDLRGPRLLAAGAEAVVDDMADLATALETS